MAPWLLMLTTVSATQQRLVRRIHHMIKALLPLLCCKRIFAVRDEPCDIWQELWNRVFTSLTLTEVLLNL